MGRCSCCRPGTTGCGRARAFRRLVEERLARHRFAHAVIHHSYPGAGHIFPTPYVPTTNTTLVDTPGGEAKIAFGVTAEANYRGGVAAWHRTL